jgi:endogenous inhibitor of DNA gyrase (YacG/DUF329 family)
LVGASRELTKLPKYFPFCSQRCKLIDLGAWLDAEYRVSDQPEEQPELPRFDESCTEDDGS